MQHTLDQVRGILQRWVMTHASLESRKEMRETILLKDGCLHGYRFCIGSVQAVWLIGGVTIEVRRDGRLADTVAISSDDSQRAA
ncbi:MAG: hypothetical protein ACR2NP_15725 [Pirellulaceae bacterium]